MEVYILASIIIVTGISTILLAAYYPIRTREQIKDVEGEKEGEAVITLLRFRLLIIGVITIISGCFLINDIDSVPFILITLTISVIAMMCFSNKYLEKRYNYKNGIRVRE